MRSATGCAPGSTRSGTASVRPATARSSGSTSRIRPSAAGPTSRDGRSSRSCCICTCWSAATRMRAAASSRCRSRSRSTTSTASRRRSRTSARRDHRFLTDLSGGSYPRAAYWFDDRPAPVGPRPRACRGRWRGRVRGRRPAPLVQLRPRAPPWAAPRPRATGATLVVPQLRLWKVRSSAVVHSLAASRSLAFAERERTYAVAAAAAVPSDPLADEEWWRAAVRVDTLEPPGPGVPVTIVDSGLFFDHPEFAGRPNVVALNNQEPAPIGGVHGTAVASVVGAPVNGVGVVGIYPEASLRIFDASLGDGT